MLNSSMFRISRSLLPPLSSAPCDMLCAVIKEAQADRMFSSHRHVVLRKAPHSVSFLIAFHLVFLPHAVIALQGVTRIKFLTDGVLLREMMEDPLLSKYRCGDILQRLKRIPCYPRTAAEGPARAAAR